MSQVTVTGQAVDREEEHVVPKEVYPYSAGLTGGFLGGVAMAVVAMLSGILMGKGPWYPLNLVGATIVRPMLNAPEETLAQFDLSLLALGFILHIQLSLGIGLLFTLLLPTLPGPPLAWSIVLGPLLWFWAQFVFLPVINPRIAQEASWLSFLIAHLVYALVLGWWVQRTPKIRAGWGVP
jgi:hypothetical protein